MPETKLIQLPDGTFFRVFGQSFDPAAEAQKYLEAVSALSLSKANQEQTVSDAIATEQATVADMLQKLTDAATLDPSVQAAIQPVLDSAQQQFPTTVAKLK